MGLPMQVAYELPRAEEIPAARAPWRLETGRAALLVHDMQRYFLACFDDAVAPLKPVLTHVAALLGHCRARGVPVFYTAQAGDQERRDRGLQADLWGAGMRAVAEHEAIAEDVAPTRDDQVLVKHRYSAFQRSHLAELLRVRGRDQLLIAGVYTHIGVLASASDAFQLDIEPFVVADGVADFDRRDHDLALEIVADTCGVPLATETILETLQ